MIVSATAAAAVLMLGTPDATGVSGAGDRLEARAPHRLLDGASPSSSLDLERPQLMTISDAPTTPAQSFTASALTVLTGVGILGGLGEGPQLGLPMSNFSLQARIATSLLLLSVGPSMGDLMNHDVSAFLTGSGGRTLLAALGWGAVSLAITSPDSVAIALSTLFVTLGALVWVGWGATDLVRSLFAPERWVDRENQARFRSRVADSTRASRPPGRSR
jgi:hypothetical protein